MAGQRKRNLVDPVLNRSAGAYIVLDGDGKIRFCSPGVETLLGWKAEELQGMICEPSVGETATPVELFASAMAPLIEVREGQVVSTDVVLPLKKGGGLNCRLLFFPVLDDDSVPVRIVVRLEAAPASPASDSRTGGRLVQRLHAELTTLRQQFRRRFRAEYFVGESPAIKRALQQAQLMQQTTAGCSIVGPSGSGRRHLSRVIHVGGVHHEASYVCVDCRLLTADQLFDSLRTLRQLHRRAAATAPQRLGTLAFFDADLCPREVQHWLLSEGQSELENVRLIAISERPLAAAEEEGWLMPDFCELFSTLQIQLPALHYRQDDIILLAQHFIEECRRTLQTSAEGMAADVQKELLFYRWPGNVRELRQVMTEACQNSFGQRLEIEDMPFAFRSGQQAQQLPATPEAAVRSLEDIMRQFETDVITATLESCGGNKAEAARRLGMTRPRLYRRLRTLGLEAEDDAR